MEDVIVRSPRGYHLSEKLTVHVIGQSEITDKSSAANVRNVRDRESENVRNDVRDQGAEIRRSWILQALIDEQHLKTQHVAIKFGIARKTAERDLQRLVADGEIEYLGSRRSGYYSLRQSSPKMA